MAFTIKENKDKKILTDCSDEKGIVEIPEGVTEIGNGDCSVLPDSELSVNSSVAGIKIPSSVKKINEQAFYRSTVDSVEFSEGLEEIGENAFRKSFRGYKAQQEIYFPKSLKLIKAGAFSATGIKKVHVGDSVEIKENAFPKGIEVVFFDKDGNESKDVCKHAFILEEDYDELEIEKEEHETNIKKYLEQYPEAEDWIRSSELEMCYKITGLKNHALTDKVLDFDLFRSGDNYSIYTEICEEVFKDCNLLESVLIPCDIKRIGEGAFVNENLKTAIVPAECEIVDSYSDDSRNSFLRKCDVFRYEETWENPYPSNTLTKYTGTKNIVTIPSIIFDEIDGKAFNPKTVKEIIIPEDCSIKNKDVLKDKIKVFDENGMRVL